MCESKSVFFKEMVLQGRGKLRLAWWNIEDDMFFCCLNTLQFVDTYYELDRLNKN